MGESGCGKTILIKYLSKLVTGELPHILKVNGGTTADEIRNFIHENKDSSRYLFLDEINTCEHLPLIKSIIIDRVLDGEPLPTGMRVLAAANPYRVRDDKDVHTSGLRASRDTDEGSRLVYRVNILPDSVMDIACNYAMLTDDEERLYTLKMVDNALVQQRPSDLSKVPTKWVNTVAA